MRTTLRWARTRPLTAAAVVATMALGIGAATAVYAVVDAVVLRALPVRDAGRLVWMWNARVERDRAPFSAPDLADYRAQNKVLEGVAPFINWTANLTGAGDPERLEGVRVDPGFFDLLGVPAVSGRVFVESDGRARVTMLTERLWRRRFGADPAIVGRDLSLNGAAYTVVGVLPRGFVFPFRDAEIAVPLSIETDSRRTDRGAGFLRVVARLKPGVTAAAAKADLDGIAARLRRAYPDANGKKIGVNLFPLDREIVGDARPLLLTLLGGSGLLLLVACANMANLLLVAFASRRRELSLRVALGATRRRILSQILGEIAILVIAGGAVGLLFGRALARVLVWWAGAALPRLDGVGLTPGVCGVAIAMTAIAALLCGLVPAWLLSDAPAMALAEAGRSATEGARHGRVQRAFVAAQIASSLILLVATVLTVRSFVKLQSVDPGFEGRNVLSVQLALPPSRYSRPRDLTVFADRLHAQLTALDGVTEAAAISLLPLSGLLNTLDYRAAGLPEPLRDEIPQAHFRMVTPAYFRVMGIRLVAGREFEEADRETTRRVAAISQTLARRHWPGASAIGEHIIVGRDALEIVGVCADVKQFGLEAGSSADLYVPLRQMPQDQAPFVAARMYWVAGTAKEPLAVADSVRRAVREVDKDVAASSMRTMDQIVRSSTGSRRFIADLLRIAGLAGVLLAVLGVYGVTAFSVGSRRREIGIRLTLGGTRTQVMRPLLGGELRWILAGLTIGACGALAVSRALSTVLFGADGMDVLSIAGVSAALAGAAVAACCVPAWRALRGDPAAALRHG
jgi:putative ABC transport system permease protein